MFALPDQSTRLSYKSLTCVMILFYIKWTHLVTVPDVTGCTLKHCPRSAETVLSPVNSVHVNEETENCPGFCGHQPRLVVSSILAGHNERRGIPALCGVRCVVCSKSTHIHKARYAFRKGFYLVGSYPDCLRPGSLLRLRRDL